MKAKRSEISEESGWPQGDSAPSSSVLNDWCLIYLIVMMIPFFFFFLLSTGGWRNNSIQTQQDSRSLQQRSFPAVILSSSSLSADNRERLIHLMRWGDEEDWVDDCSPEFPDWIKPSKSIVASWNTVCMLQQLSGASNNRIQMCFCDCYSPFG